ncbi:MAG: Fur family transcriptional regulator [Candidatus Dojkabacteria bacterium]
MNTVDELLAKLRAKGYRSSRLKRRILEYLAQSQLPMTIPDIMKRLEKEGIPCNKSSLYRETDKLLEENIIIEIDLLDGIKRYEINNEVHHHHALCVKCGAVICVEIPNDLEQVEKQLKQKEGFTVNGHVLEFFGVCRRCAGESE